MTRAKNTAPPASDETIAAVAKALGHPARVQIVRLLLARGTCIGGDIVDDLQLAQSTVSEHLRILKVAGVIVGEIERPRICYSLNAAALATLASLLGEVATFCSPRRKLNAACCPGDATCKRR
jgi:ArsR family transcriptional regulator